MNYQLVGNLLHRKYSHLEFLTLPFILNPSVRFTIHYNLQDMYMHTRPPFVLQGMVALPSFIILDFCVCNFNLVWSDSSSAELWLLVDTHHDTRIGAEVSAILMQSWPIENVWGMFAHSAKYIASSIRREVPHLFGWHQIEPRLRSRVIPNEATQVERFPALF